MNALYKNNAASRVAAVLARTATFDGKQVAALDVWAAAFGVDEEDQHERAIKVTAFLGCLRSELRTAERALRTMLPVEAYERTLATIADATSPMYFWQPWEPVRSKLQAFEALHYLTHTVAAVLPEDEAAESEETVVALLQSIADAEALIREDAELSKDLRLFLLRSLARMRQALQEYPIAGAEALADVYRALRDEIASFDGMPGSKTTGRPSVRRVMMIAAAIGSIVTATGKVGGDLDKISKGANVLAGLLPEARTTFQLTAPTPKQIEAKSSAAEDVPDSPAVLEVVPE